MAVYTEIGDDELRDFTALYDIGEVLSCKGIAEGVENSNYLLTTAHGTAIAVERELHQRFGRTAQLRTSDEQGERIGKLLESGQLDCRLLVLHGNSSPGSGPGNGAASPPPSD